MSEPASETFDCVQSMRESRDKLSAEIAHLSYDDLVKWMRGRRYSDPLLERLAQRIAQGAVSKLR